MRGKILFSAALAAVVGLFAFAPNAAQAHGDLVVGEGQLYAAAPS